MHIAGGVWIVSGGVWMVSGWGVRVSGRCLGVYLCHINWKQLNKSRNIKLLPFLSVPSNAHKTPISGGCLDNVWWCLDGVWMTSQGVWEILGVYRCHINWKQVNKSHNIKLLPFLLVLSNAQKRPYLGVSGWGLRVSGKCIGVYRCHINWKQLNKSRNIKLLPFLPVFSNAQKRLYLGVSG